MVETEYVAGRWNLHIRDVNGKTQWVTRVDRSAIMSIVRLVAESEFYTEWALYNPKGGIEISSVNYLPF